MAVRKSVAIAIAVVGMSSPAFAQSGTFQGWHVGGVGGGAWGHQDQTGGVFILPGGGSTITCIENSGGTTCFANPVGDGRYSLSGGLIGGTVGYDWQNGPYVFGFEGDGSWADISGNGTCGPPAHACGGSVNALGTVRGRLGYDVGKVAPWGRPMLAYVTGGLAVGDVHAWDSLFGTSGSKTATGWTVGGGLEAYFAANWSVKLEYLHVDLGDPAVFTAIPPTPERVSTKFDMVRVGLNYYFNWTPPPVSPSPIVTKAPPISK